MKSLRFKVHRTKGVTFDAPSLTQSQFQRDCDINVMIRRALAGDINAIVKGNVVDASNAPESLHEAFDILARANTAWEELPAAVRHAYGNKERFVKAYDEEVQRLAQKPVEKPVERVETVSPEKGEGSAPESVPSNT